MSDLTPELRAEIAQRLRASSGIRHCMVFRDMERGLDPEQMASAQDTNPENVRNYIRSLEDLLSGRLPKTRRRRKSKPAPTASCWAETCRQGSAVM